MATASNAARTFIRPPSLALLPRLRRRNGSMLGSSFLHAMAMAAWIFLPALFPSPVFIRVSNISKPAAPEEMEPLVAPQLPALADSGSGSKPAKAASGAGSGSALPQADPPPQKPDYIGPQEIVSYVPNPVNRIQTIRRPDLVKPASLKFPLRLQSMVSLPAARPVLAPPPRPATVPDVAVAEEVPIAQLAVPNPALTLVPKQVAVAPAEATPHESTPSALAPAEPVANTAKAAIVVNAVNVPPDSSAALPDAELAGKFVVGPAPSAAVAEKSSPAGTGSSSAAGAAKSSESTRSGPESGHGNGTGSGSLAGPGGTNRTDPGGGTGSGTVGAKGASEGNGKAGSRTGNGSGSGAPGHGAGSGNPSGISISGGISGPRGATGSIAAPLHRSYGLTIISGGSSGGASRDVGFFNRDETVYSVTIPMADAGGGPDWTMQYALAIPAQAGTGMLSPPFVQKKVTAAMPRTALTGAAGPVFISGVIDENGKLQSLKAIRAPDARSQPAIRALQQWEFLPAQLDGKPVASKVLIGVSMTAAAD